VAQPFASAIAFQTRRMGTNIHIVIADDSRVFRVPTFVGFLNSQTRLSLKTRKARLKSVL